MKLKSFQSSGKRVYHVFIVPAIAEPCLLPWGEQFLLLLQLLQTEATSNEAIVNIR